MAGNLEFIKSETITTSVLSVDVTNCFSADYDVYKITINDFSTAGATQTNLNGRYIDSGGSVITASNYDMAYLNLKSNVAFGEDRFTNQTSLFYQFGVIDQSPEGNGGVLYIFNPFSSSSYTFSLSQTSGALSGVLQGTKHIGVLKQTASMTGIQIFDANGSRPFDEGKISIYGVK